ncbi:MAG: nucleotidyltransferase family protein [Pyrinomonadaceae bacterium]
MNEIKNKIGIIVLAAGSSSRLGQPKQLLKFKGKTFIRRIVESALNTNCHPVVVVVLGANFELIKDEILDLDCEIIFNADWQTGMSSSIKNGLSKLLEIAPDITAVIISLCDQPLIRSEHFEKLIAKYFEIKKPIVASAYEAVIGVPALFSKKFFPALLNLEDDQGAKEIIYKNPDEVGKIISPELAIDVDTKEDFEKLRSTEINFS